MTDDNGHVTQSAGPGFTRARRSDHQDVRREALVAAAADQLQSRRAVDLTLGHVAMAVGMSKSSVLRYFSSREALLLEVLARQWSTWVEEAASHLPPSGASIREATVVLAAQAAHRPVMCDLISVAPAVLEHNADPADVVRFKTAVLASTLHLARALALSVPGLGDQRAEFGAKATWVLIAGLWPLAQVRPDVDEILSRAGAGDAMVTFESALSAMTTAILSSADDSPAEPAGPPQALD